MKNAEFGLNAMGARFSILVRRNILLVLLMPVLTGFVNADSAVWQKASGGIDESEIRTLAVHPVEHSIIFAGTARAVYKSINGGKDYKAVLRPAGQDTAVNSIYVFPDKPQVIYAAAQGGLYESLDTGETWQRIYHPSDAVLEGSLCVLRQADRIYMGTPQGLLWKKISENKWHAMEGALGNEPVYHIASDQGFIYFAAGRALFRQENQTGVTAQIFSAGLGGIQEENGVSEESVGEEPAFESASFIKSLRVGGPPGALVMATSRGIYGSRDNGAAWHKIASDHIPLEEITSLTIWEDDRHGDCAGAPVEDCLGLWAGTRRGAFLFSRGKWMPLYQGMETNRVNELITDAAKTVYAATDRGIFYLPCGKALPFFDLPHTDAGTAGYERRLESLDKYFNGEPTIEDVQRLAVDYAEVHPQKIARWRRLVGKRAWLPELDVSFDGGTDWSSSDSIWGSSSSGGQHYVGPDDKTRGEDFGWDVTLSWNLGDLIWSTDQTTIDSRSKLMVELREDVLDQVTRIYFERRRNQIELLTADDWEPYLRMDKELRVAELTALIDAFTGGEFSRRIQKRSSEENLSIAAQTKEKEELL